MGGLLLASCNKTDDLTIVEGIVTDANTGVRLKEVNVSYLIREDAEKDKTIHQSKFFITDTSGHYHIQCLESQYITGIVFFKEGYLPGFHGMAYFGDIEEGEYNEVNVKLKPK